MLPGFVTSPHFVSSQFFVVVVVMCCLGVILPLKVVDAFASFYLNVFYQ